MLFQSINTKTDKINEEKAAKLEKLLGSVTAADERVTDQLSSLVC